MAKGVADKKDSGGTQNLQSRGRVGKSCGNNVNDSSTHHFPNREPHYLLNALFRRRIRLSPSATQRASCEFSIMPGKAGSPLSPHAKPDMHKTLGTLRKKPILLRSSGCPAAGPRGIQNAFRRTKPKLVGIDCSYRRFVGPIASSPPFPRGPGAYLFG